MQIKKFKNVAYKLKVLKLLKLKSFLKLNPIDFVTTYAHYSALGNINKSSIIYNATTLF